MSATRPPLDYLVNCSQMSLESVELSRLNLASNLRKEFQQILEEWIDSEVDARLARSVLEWRRAQSSAATTRKHEPPKSLQFQQLAIAFLPEPAESPEGDSLENNRRVSQVDARLGPLPLSEIAQPNTSAPRWTSLARAAAASSGAIDGLEERHAKTPRSYRRTTPPVTTDRRLPYTSGPALDFREVRKHAGAAIELAPLRASSVRTRVTPKTSTAARSRAPRTHTSAPLAVRETSRSAEVWRSWVSSALRSGAEVALQVVTADAS